jgi:hypothetical protein
MGWFSSSVSVWHRTHATSFLRKPFSAVTSLRRLWPLLVERYPAFATYQARTEREIPVVTVGPRGVRFSPAARSARRMATAQGRF